MKLNNKIVLATLALVSVTTPAYAGPFPPPVLAVPALDEWGVIGLGVIVGVAGLLALFKHK